MGMLLLAGQLATVPTASANYAALTEVAYRYAATPAVYVPVPASTWGCGVDGRPQSCLLMMKNHHPAPGSEASPMAIAQVCRHCSSRVQQEAQGRRAVHPIPSSTTLCTAVVASLSSPTSYLLPPTPLVQRCPAGPCAAFRRVAVHGTLFLTLQWRPCVRHDPFG